MGAKAILKFISKKLGPIGGALMIGEAILEAFRFFSDDSETGDSVAEVGPSNHVYTMPSAERRKEIGALAPMNVREESLKFEIARAVAAGARDAVADPLWRRKMERTLVSNLELLRERGDIGEFLDAWIKTEAGKTGTPLTVVDLMDTLYSSMRGVLAELPAVFYYVTPLNFIKSMLSEALAQPEAFEALVEEMMGAEQEAKVAINFDAGTSKVINDFPFIKVQRMRNSLRTLVSAISLPDVRAFFTLLQNPAHASELTDMLYSLHQAWQLQSGKGEVVKAAPSPLPAKITPYKALQVATDAYCWANKNNRSTKGARFDSDTPTARFWLSGIGDALTSSLKNIGGQLATQAGGKLLSAGLSFIPGVGPVAASVVDTAMVAAPGIAQATGIPVDNFFALKKMGDTIEKSKKKAKGAAAKQIANLTAPAVTNLLTSPAGLSPVYRTTSSDSPLGNYIVDTAVKSAVASGKANLNAADLRDHFGAIVKYFLGETLAPSFLSEPFWHQVGVDMQQLMVDIAWYIQNGRFQQLPDLPAVRSASGGGAKTPPDKKKDDDEGGLGGLIDKWGGALLDLIGLGGDDDDEDEEEEEEEEKPKKKKQGNKVPAPRSDPVPSDTPWDAPSVQRIYPLSDSDLVFVRDLVTRTAHRPECPWLAAYLEKWRGIKTAEELQMATIGELKQVPAYDQVTYEPCPYCHEGVYFGGVV